MHNYLGGNIIPLTEMILVQNRCVNPALGPISSAGLGCSKGDISALINGLKYSLTTTIAALGA